VFSCLDCSEFVAGLNFPAFRVMSEVRGMLESSKAVHAQLQRTILTEDPKGRDRTIAHLPFITCPLLYEARQTEMRPYSGGRWGKSALSPFRHLLGVRGRRDPRYLGYMQEHNKRCVQLKEAMAAIIGDTGDIEYRVSRKECR